MQRLADRLIQIPEGAAIGYTLRGVVHYDEENHEDAAAAFERVLALDPDLKVMPLPTRLFWDQLISELMKTGRAADARRYLVRALANTQDAALMTTLGVANDLEGEIDEAERCLRQAIEWDSTYSPAYAYLGRLELYRRQYDNALSHLLKAVKLNPGNYSLLYTLSQAYRQHGELEEAARYQAKAVAVRTKQEAIPPRSQKIPLPRYAL